MILSTIQDEATGLNKEIAILGKSWSKIKTDFAKGGNFKSSIFSAFQSDASKFKVALKEMNEQIKNGVPKIQACQNAMSGLGKDYKKLGKDLATGKITMKDLNGQMKSMSLSGQIASKAMQMLSIAIDMVIYAAATEIITIFINQLKDIGDTTSQLSKNISKLKDQYDKHSNSLDDINSKLDENKSKIEDILKLENPTYVDSEQLKLLKIENAELEKRKKITEDSKAATGQKLLNTENQSFETGFYSHDKELDKLTKKAFDWKNLLSFGGYNVYKSVQIGNSKTDAKEYETALNAAKEYSDYKQKLIDSGKETLEIDGVNMSLSDIGKVIKGQKKILQKYQTDFLSKIDDIDDIEGYENSDLYKGLMERIDQIQAIINPDTYATDKIKEYLSVNKNDSDTINQLFSDKSIKKWSDLVSNEDSNPILKAIATSIYGNDGDEEVKQTASYMWKAFRENVESDSKDNPIVIGKDSLKFEEIYNSADFETQRKQLIELVASGEITPEIISNNNKYKKLIEDTGYSAEEAAKKLDEMVTASDRLGTFGDKLDKLSTAYTEFKENGYVSIDAIDALDPSLKKMPSFNDFAKTVGDANINASSQQEAFNKLASEWMVSSEVLKRLDETTRGYYETQLKNVGIINATKVVTDQLTAKQDAERIIREKNNLTMEEFLKLSPSQISQLDGIGNASEQCRSYILALQLADENLTNQLSNFDANGKIKELAKLANAYGLAGTTAQENAKRLQNAEKQSASLGTDFTTVDFSDYDYNKAYEDFVQKVNAKYAELFKSNYSNNASDAAKNAKNAAKAAKSAEKSKQAFDFVEIKIKRLEDVISRFNTLATNAFKNLTTRAGAYGDEISKVTDEISLQNTAYNRYMQEANSVGLAESWASQVRNGSINIATITDDTLKTQISNYQTWYEKCHSIW